MSSLCYSFLAILIQRTIGFSSCLLEKPRFQEDILGNFSSPRHGRVSEERVAREAKLEEESVPVSEIST